MIQLAGENDATLDGVPIPADARKGLAPIDVYVPLTLVRQASELMFRTRNFDVTYLFVVSFGLGPLLGDLARYDMHAAFAVLDAAIDLAFVNPDGSPAHFSSLYEGSGDRDGWNAVIRLCAFLVQLEKRVNEAAQLADAIGKTIVLAVTTHFISNVLPKQTPRWKKLLGGRTEPPLEGSAALIEKAVKTGKIGGMAFGVGLALPQVLETFGLTGPEKTGWKKLTDTSRTGSLRAPKLGQTKKKPATVKIHLKAVLPYAIRRRPIEADPPASGRCLQRRFDFLLASARTIASCEETPSA